MNVLKDGEQGWLNFLTGPRLCQGRNDDSSTEANSHVNIVTFL